MTLSESRSPLLLTKQCLLIVVDMQEALLRSIFECERLIARIRLLIQGANILDIPMIATTQNAVKLGQIAPQIAELLPTASHPIDKLTFSCYSSTEFISALDSLQRRQILLCGVESHICISQTAHDLTAAGYQVHVAVDAVSSRTELNWHTGLDRMRANGIQMTSAEMALYEILRVAGSPEFKEILKLVK